MSVPLWVGIPCLIVLAFSLVLVVMVMVSLWRDGSRPWKP